MCVFLLGLPVEVAQFGQHLPLREVFLGVDPVPQAHGPCKVVVMEAAAIDTFFMPTQLHQNAQHPQANARVDFKRSGSPIAAGAIRCFHEKIRERGHPGMIRTRATSCVAGKRLQAVVGFVGAALVAMSLYRYLISVMFQLP
ncbi:MAG: hypothetical protein WBA56_08820 [Stenotrophomonas sp.]